jgi:hypothetical protein
LNCIAIELEIANCVVVHGHTSSIGFKTLIFSLFFFLFEFYHHWAWNSQLLQILFKNMVCSLACILLLDLKLVLYDVYEFYLINIFLIILRVSLLDFRSLMSHLFIYLLFFFLNLLCHVMIFSHWIFLFMVIIFL